MGREVRRVPADWQHPKYTAAECREYPNRIGSYRPLFPQSFESVTQEWDRDAAKWNDGFVSDWSGGWKPREPKFHSGTYEEYAGKRPSEPGDYMPNWSEDQRTHFMMYENVSEGTPISPAFPTPKELARWLAANGASAFGRETASYEAWLRVCTGGYAPSMIGTMTADGMKLQSGVEALKDK